jgi:hypothetical protein
MFTEISTERGGFEPPMAFAITVFETAAFNRSATSPVGCFLALNEFNII